MNYKVFMTLADLGPWYSRLILSLPDTVSQGSVNPSQFSVYVDCIDPDTKSTALKTDWITQTSEPMNGYVKISAAWPCDADGSFQLKSDHVALLLEEESLNRPIIGNVLTSKRLEHHYRITQIGTIYSDKAVLNGMVFDTCEGRVCPSLSGWQNGEFTSSAASGSVALGYGWYMPTASRNHIPLLVWLHGAGEGGKDPEIAYTGNYVAGITEPGIQKALGKDAAGCSILVPQCPTVWMDNGEEQLGRSNQSIYAAPLYELIRHFSEEHADTIDTSRIYIGGLSNGGFLTLRMMADYPEMFAGAVPVCAPFYTENSNKTEIMAIASKPVWFVHCKGDPLVPPEETTLPLYTMLKEAGASDLHYSLFDHVDDPTGRYKNPDGSTQRFFAHGVWMYVYRDLCSTDLDGRRVFDNGLPVTLWEWLGRKSL